jgi:hypothetical protein
MGENIIGLTLDCLSALGSRLLKPFRIPEGSGKVYKVTGRSEGVEPDGLLIQFNGFFRPAYVVQTYGIPQLDFCLAWIEGNSPLRFSNRLVMLPF